MTEKSTSPWDEIAKKVAEFIHQEMFESHRGVIPSQYQNVMAAFGNNGYSTNIKSQREVDATREFITDRSGQVLGFGVSSNGYSWAILYHADNMESFEVLEIMWDTWLGKDQSELIDKQTLAEMTAFRSIQTGVSEKIARKNSLTVLPADLINLN